MSSEQEIDVEFIPSSESCPARISFHPDPPGGAQSLKMVPKGDEQFEFSAITFWVEESSNSNPQGTSQTFEQNRGGSAIHKSCPYVEDIRVEPNEITFTLKSDCEVDFVRYQVTIKYNDNFITSIGPNQRL